MSNKTPLKDKEPICEVCGAKLEDDGIWFTICIGCFVKKVEKVVGGSS